MSHHHETAFQQFLAREKHLASMVLQRAEKYGNKTALRHKPYGTWESISWHQFGLMARATASKLLQSGVQNNEPVGIFSQNRAEWNVVDTAIQMLRAVTVPIYATHSLEETRYIVRHAEIRVMFVNDQAQYDKACELLTPTTQLCQLIVFDRSVVLKPNERSIYFADYLQGAPQKEVELDEILSQVSSDDLATIIYTSGTTGEPKGVMLTHKSFLAMIYAAGTSVPLTEEDVSISWLPLSHIFERSWTYFVFSRGAQNDYCMRPKEAIEYFAEVKPHYMTSVPRIWEKLHLNIMNSVKESSPLKQHLFHWALAVGRDYYGRKVGRANISGSLMLRHWLAQRLVLGKIQGLVGGRCKSFNCGGAPVAAHISEFFFSAGIMLAQGYGMTEFFPICVTTPEHIKHGTCGPIVPLTQISISADGEILAKGPTCMRGYYKNEEATREIMNEAGWLKTGDQGFIDENGYIVITDRIKELIITSGGKNISPLKIESALKENLYIEQAVALGNNRPYVGALIVPSFSMLDAYGHAHGLKGATKEQLVSHPKIIDLYAQIIKECCRELSPYEQVKRFVLLPRDLTQENGEMTATAKLRRRVIDQNFSDIIRGLYS